MENFSRNSAKSYIGKNVNLHLKDGSVIINVQLTKIKKDGVGKLPLLEYVPFKARGKTSLSMKFVAWAEQLNPNLLSSAV
jgi:hypothetical protein